MSIVTPPPSATGRPASSLFLSLTFESYVSSLVLRCNFACVLEFYSENHPTVIKMADVAAETQKVATPEKEVAEKKAEKVDGEKTPVKEATNGTHKPEENGDAKENGTAEEDEQESEETVKEDTGATKRKSEASEATDGVDKTDGATPEKKAKVEEQTRIESPTKAEATA